MLPLPVQLSSPTLDTSYATSDGESPFCVTKPLITASAVEDNSRCCDCCTVTRPVLLLLSFCCSSRKLKRFKSFHGFPVAKKQITVPVVGKKSKKVSKVFIIMGIEIDGNMCCIICYRIIIGTTKSLALPGVCVCVYVCVHVYVSE